MLRISICFTLLCYLGCTASSVEPAQTGRWIDVAVGTEHVCAIFSNNLVATDGDLYCWGQFSDTGLNEKKSHPVAVRPQFVESKGPFKMVTSGFGLICAISSSNELICSAPGIGVQTVKIPGATGGVWKSIEAGGLSLVATTTSLQSFQFDFTSSGFTNRAIAGEWSQLSVSDNQFALCPPLDANCICGTTSARDGVRCITKLPIPSLPGNWPVFGADEKWNEISVGGDFTCVKGEANNRICCLGANERHQLGDGKTLASNKPVFLADEFGAAAWSQMSTGFKHACAIRRDKEPGSLWCWGDNEFGQLGVGDVRERSKPIRALSGDTHFIKVSAGGNTTCAISTSNDLYCWGNAANGKIGVGNWNELANCSSTLCFVPMQVTKPFAQCKLKSLPSGQYKETCKCDLAGEKDGTCTLNCCCEEDLARQHRGGRQTSIGNVGEGQSFENLDGIVTEFKNGSPTSNTGSSGDTCTEYPCRKCGTTCCSEGGGGGGGGVGCSTLRTRQDCERIGGCHWHEGYWFWEPSYCYVIPS